MAIYPHTESYSESDGEDPRFTEMMDEMPRREVFVKDNDDKMVGTGLLLLEDNTLLAPEGFGTESGSINFGDLITLSEASGFLAIQNNLNGGRYRLVDHYVPKNAPSSTPGYVHMYEAENQIVTQSSTNTILNANPLIFNYTTQLMSRVNSISFKANAPMTNVRIKITAVQSGVVVKYYPTKASWVQSIDGLNFTVGDNFLDFKDTPLLFEPGEELRFEIRANNVSLLGNASGVPYLSAMVQRGRFRYLANIEDVPTSLSQLSNDAGFLKQNDLPSIPDKTSDLTNDSNFITANQAPVQSVNGQSGAVSINIPEQVIADWNSTEGKSVILNKPALSQVAISGNYSDLSNKPLIPTNTNQLTNGSGFITELQAASSAPVQSVNGQQGVINLTIPQAQIQSDWNQSNASAVDFIKNKPSISSVTYPVTSVNGKTGAVALVNSDVGAAATSHVHAIADVTGLQTALNAKISVGASIPYNTISGTPALATVATSGSYVDLLNKPTLFDGTYASLTGKPTSFTPSSHTHAISEVIGLQSALDSKVSTSNLTTLGLRRVETFISTSDATGSVTITFNNTYTTPPDIQPQIIGGTFNQFIRVVSVNNTQAVVQVAQRNTVTLLSVEVLLGATVPVSGASISIQVTART